MKTLNQQLQQSLLFSFLDKYFGYFLRFVSTIIIARLLTPEEVGIFSVAFVVISIGHVLRDFGVAQYLIQEKELNDQKIKAAFGVMFVIAWSMWAVLWMSKSAFATFYAEPKLKEALTVLIIIFLLAPFGSVRIALLRRNMAFKTLAKINIFSYITLFIVSVGLCYLKIGFMALVWGQLAGVIATNIGCMLACKRQYWYFPSLTGSKAVFRFGYYITLANIMENTAEGAPDLFIGKLMNMQAVGLFSRAQGCVSLFRIFVNASVWPVILPYFSIKSREGGTLLPDYLKAISIYTAFAWPFFAALMILAKPMVMLLYGGQWVESIILVQVLCLSALLEACFPFRGPLLISMGKAKEHLSLQFTVSALRILSILIGSYFGLIYAAISLVVAELVSQVYIYYTLNRLIDFKLGDWLHMVKISGFLSMCIGLISLTIIYISEVYFRQSTFSHDWIIIAVAAFIGGFVWVGIVLFSNHVIKTHALQWFSKQKQLRFQEGSL